MNLIYKVDFGKKPIPVTIHELQFTWYDMLQFGEWCAENDAAGLDGLVLADYLKEKHNIEIK